MSFSNPNAHKYEQKNCEINLKSILIETTQPQLGENIAKSSNLYKYILSHYLVITTLLNSRNNFI